MRKNVSRFPKERPGEPLIDWEERELMKKAKKLAARQRYQDESSPSLKRQDLRSLAPRINRGNERQEPWSGIAKVKVLMPD
jgi:hypothetical protein